MLVPAVDDALRAVLAAELDQVVAGDVRGAGELGPQRLVEPAAERLAAAVVLSDAHVLGEEPAERVEVAHVERQRVARDELPDLLDRLEPLEPPRERGVAQPFAPSRICPNP